MLHRSLGPYTLVAELGEGGMGEVYLGWRRRGGAPESCVVKKIRGAYAGNDEMVTRFQDEARALAGLAHPNIARFVDAGLIERRPYLAIEHVRGVPLRELHKSVTPLPQVVVRHVVMGLLAGLEHAHQSVDAAGRPRRLVHRDVTPSNVMLTWRGDVKLIDFGVARYEDRETHTRPGNFVGKLRYAAPEQLIGSAVDASTDLFAVGILLYELLTARRYYGRLADESVAAHLMDPAYLPPALSTLSPSLRQVVASSTSRSSKARFPDVAAFRMALELAFAAAGVAHDDGAARTEELLDALCVQARIEDAALTELLDTSIRSAELDAVTQRFARPPLGEVVSFFDGAAEDVRTTGRRAPIGIALATSDDGSLPVTRPALADEQTRVSAARRPAPGKTDSKDDPVDATQEHAAVDDAAGVTEERAPTLSSDDPPRGGAASSDGPTLRRIAPIAVPSSNDGTGHGPLPTSSDGATVVRGVLALKTDSDEGARARSQPSDPAAALDGSSDDGAAGSSDERFPTERFDFDPAMLRPRSAEDLPTIRVDEATRVTVTDPSAPPRAQSRRPSRRPLVAALGAAAVVVAAVIVVLFGRDARVESGPVANLPRVDVAPNEDAPREDALPGTPPRVVDTAPGTQPGTQPRVVDTAPGTKPRVVDTAPGTKPAVIDPAPGTKSKLKRNPVPTTKPDPVAVRTLPPRPRRLASAVRYVVTWCPAVPACGAVVKQSERLGDMSDAEFTALRKDVDRCLDACRAPPPAP